MSIQRAAAPAGVENFLCYLIQEATALPTQEATPKVATPVEPGFWKQLFSEGLAAWPAINASSVRLAAVPYGCLFTVEDEQGLLVMGGVGIQKAGVAWEKLTETVGEIRQQATAAVGQSPGGKELMAHWDEQVQAPAENQWLTLVPMIGLRYYATDAERIMQLACGLGTDLIRICDRGELPN